MASLVGQSHSGMMYAYILSDSLSGPNVRKNRNEEPGQVVLQASLCSGAGVGAKA